MKTVDSDPKRPTLDPSLFEAIEAQTGRPESPVKVCFTGRVRKGSWKIRGLQIAACRRNWHASYELNSSEIGKYDLFCVVKKPDDSILKMLTKSGATVVYDIVDPWAQPEDGIKISDVSNARELFAGLFDRVKASSYIFANRTMKQHLRPLVPHGTFIYHHYWPNVSLNPIRDKVDVVGYEGNPRYLGEWADTLRAACDRRGWKFVINPTNLTDIDIGIIARGSEDDNFLSNNYKSNVKLANFYGAGTPCLVSAKEMSCHETDEGDVRFFSTSEELDAQLEQLTDYHVRKAVHERFLRIRNTYSIRTIANLFDVYFQEVLRNLGK